MYEGAPGEKQIKRTWKGKERNGVKKYRKMLSIHVKRKKQIQEGDNMWPEGCRYLMGTVDTY
jgi:hypothetical protein